MSVLHASELDDVSNSYVIGTLHKIHLVIVIRILIRFTNSHKSDSYKHLASFQWLPLYDLLPLTILRIPQLQECPQCW